jgi:hypothetical protein
MRIHGNVGWSWFCSSAGTSEKQLRLGVWEQQDFKARTSTRVWCCLRLCFESRRRVRFCCIKEADTMSSKHKKKKKRKRDSDSDSSSSSSSSSSSPSSSSSSSSSPSPRSDDRLVQSTSYGEHTDPYSDPLLVMFPFGLPPDAKRRKFTLHAGSAAAQDMDMSDESDDDEAAARKRNGEVVYSAKHRRLLHAADDREDAGALVCVCVCVCVCVSI